MKKTSNTSLQVQGTSVKVHQHHGQDYICLTDMVSHFEGENALIKEFQRLKDDENQRLSLSWNLNRTLSKLNCRIHTDAIKEHLIPACISKTQTAFTYATEADLLNVELFGITAQQWRAANPDKEGNMRDYATIEQLLVLANIESMNAEFIHMNLPQPDRLSKLNAIAIRQMKTLTSDMQLKLPEKTK